MYTLAVYASPGYMDMWTIKYLMYRALSRHSPRDTRVVTLGGGGQIAVAQFCQDRGYSMESIGVPSVDRLIAEVTPNRLLAFTKGGEIVWDYATLAIERGIETVLTVNATYNN